MNTPMIDKAKVENGVARWISNSSVPPQECLDQLKAEGLVFDMEKSKATRDRETAAFIREYRRRNANRQYSGEEMAEMRSAFGPGAEVVNVITGRRIKL